MQRFWNTILVASNNRSKIPEIIENLDMDGWQYYPLHSLGITEIPEEVGETYEENARIKAQAAKLAVRQEGHQMAILADDSGLEVDALGGAPGINSARYGGERTTDQRNIVKLLNELKDVPQSERTARFVCSLIFIDEEGREICAQGTCEGRIALVPRGLNGFGYDPVFLPDLPDEGDGECAGRTMAELSAEEKMRISHRGRALRALREKLIAHYEFLQYRAEDIGLGVGDGADGLNCEGCSACR